MNRLISSLSDVCTRRRLREKWLVAPSLRAGSQWIEQTALGGVPAVNLHLKTIPGLALAIAGPEMSRHGLEMVSKLQTEFLLAHLWEGVCGSRTRPAYLGRIAPDLAFIEALARTIMAVRCAGLGPDALKDAELESDIKGEELSAIFEAYCAELKRRRLVDHAGAITLAIDAAGRGSLPDDPLVLLPAHMECQMDRLELKLLDALPESQVVRLPVDEPSLSDAGGAPHGDVALLRLIGNPSQAPAPAGDGTVDFFRAAGAANEVLGVLRRCMAERIPFDEVEILYTDADTYLPLIHELAGSVFEGHRPQSGRSVMTFADGLPLHYTAPGRALSAWIEWQEQDFPQKVLERIIHEGLLIGPGSPAGQFDASELADLLRSVPIYRGRENYLPKLDEEIRAAGAAARAGFTDEDGEEIHGAGREKRLERLKALRCMIETLLDHTPGEGAESGAGFLEAAVSFLKESVRSSGQLDSYARDSLTDALAVAAGLLPEGGFGPGINLRRWAGRLPGLMRVGGTGPRPGAIHAAGMRSGGHSGRKHTFIVGLDDTRHPGTLLQDPLLLDGERRLISESLLTSESRARRREAAFLQVLAGLRGRVTLSYSSRDIKSDSELSPSPCLIAAYRVVRGRHEADMDDFLGSKEIREEASFASSSAAGCLSRADALTRSFCTDTAASDCRGEAGVLFPHLGRGLEAESARAGSAFTAFDGHVREAGLQNDPAAEGRKISASRLERFACCPLSFFFGHVLGLQLPEAFKYDPGTWLDPLQKGSVLHDVFRDFLTERLECGQPPEAGRDEDIGRIKSILDSRLDALRDTLPPPREGLEHAVRREMAEACRTFLAAQEEFYKNGVPKFLETAVGLNPARVRSPLDTVEPVSMALADARSVRLCGRIDRIDELKGSGKRAFSVWDYKTGSASRFKKKNRAFYGGRMVQHAVYLHIARERLTEHLNSPAEVRFFGYFFPGLKAAGESILYWPAQLTAAKEVIDCLCRGIAAGAFLPSEDAGGCLYCDFRSICRDPQAVAVSSERKLKNEENDMLAPLREVREYE